MCLWTNDPNSDLQWLRASGETSDSGPDSDTTLGNQFGTYIYVHEFRTRSETPTPARLISPFLTSSVKKRCVSYWNFRNGVVFEGALVVSLYDDVKDKNKELQHLTQEDIGRWNNAQVAVVREEGDGKYQIAFEAQLVTG